MINDGIAVSNNEVHRADDPVEPGGCLCSEDDVSEGLRVRGPGVLDTISCDLARRHQPLRQRRRRFDRLVEMRGGRTVQR